jgi:hypothetical protein
MHENLLRLQSVSYIFGIEPNDTSWSRVLFEKLINYRPLLESEGPVPFSQEPKSESYSEPEGFDHQTHTLLFILNPL